MQQRLLLFQTGPNFVQIESLLIYLVSIFAFLLVNDINVMHFLNIVACAHLSTSSSRLHRLHSGSDPGSVWGGRLTAGGQGQEAGE